MRVVLLLLALAVAAAAGLVLIGGVEPIELVGWVSRALGVVIGLACPVFFLLMLVAPAALYGLGDRLSTVWERLRTRRAEIEDLQHRIAHLGKPHLMAQLGAIYFRQGRYKQAAHWFRQALEKDPDLIDARYRLAICHLKASQFEPACELLEEVHRRKPDHDYGGAYLRLAQVSGALRRSERAEEVYRTLLRFYPGQPEGCFRYGKLLAERGDPEAARAQMQQVVFSVRNSPAFQRRRNRHWMLKARWWLLRNPTRESA